MEIWKGEVADEEAVQKYVEKLIDENPVLLFTKAVDLQSSRANFVLNDGGVQYNQIELDNDDYQYLTQQLVRFGSAFNDSSKKEVESEIKIKTEQIERYLMEKTGERQPLPSLFVKGQPLGGMENIAKMVESMDFQQMLDTEGIEHNLAEIQSKSYLKRLDPKYFTVDSVERILNLNGIDFRTIRHDANMAANRLTEFLTSSTEDIKNVVLSKTQLITNNEGQYWLACLPWNKEIDLDALQSYLQVKALDLQIADEGTLQRKTGCNAGNANFFSILNVKKACDLTVLFDKDLY